MRQPRWKVQLFGGITVEENHTGQALIFRSLKARLLFAYLVLYPDREHQRKWLGAMLWPDASPEGQRSNLSAELHPLRRQLEREDEANDGVVFEATRQAVLLRGAAFETDVLAFASALENAARCDGEADAARQVALERAVDLYRGPFLHGLSDPSGDDRGTDAWIEPTRLRLEQQRANALMELARLYEKRGERRQALESAFAVSDGELLTEENRGLLLRLLSDSERGKRIALFAFVDSEEISFFADDILKQTAVLDAAHETPTRREEKLLQRAIRATLDALTPKERLFLARFAFFPAGGTAEGVSAILRQPDAGALLERFVNAHLLECEIPATEEVAANPALMPFYRLPERVRTALHKESEAVLPVAEQDRLMVRLAGWFLLQGRKHSRFRRKVQSADLSARSAIEEDARQLREQIRREDTNLTMVLEWHKGQCDRDRRVPYRMARLLTAIWFYREPGRLQEFFVWEWGLLSFLESLSSNLASDLIVQIASSVMVTIKSPLPTRYIDLEKLIDAAQRYLKKEKLSSLGKIYSEAATVAHHEERDDLARTLCDAALPLLSGLAKLNCLLVYSESLFVQGEPERTRAYQEEALRLADTLTDPVAALKMTTLCQLMLAETRHFFGELEEAARLLDIVLNWCFTSRQEDGWLERALREMGAIHTTRGVFGMARQTYDQAIRCCQETNNPEAGSVARIGLGEVELRSGNLAVARTHFEEGIAVWREKGHARWQAIFLLRLADEAFHSGTYDRADELLDTAAEHVSRTNAMPSKAYIAYLRGRLALRRGDIDDALRLHREGLTLRMRYANVRQRIESLEGLAEALAAGEAGTDAATLLGTADAFRRFLGMPLPAVEQPGRETVLDRLKRRLGESGYKEAERQGAELDWEQAVSRALSNRNRREFA